MPWPRSERSCEAARECVAAPPGGLREVRVHDVLQEPVHGELHVVALAIQQLDLASLSGQGCAAQGT